MRTGGASLANPKLSAETRIGAAKGAVEGCRLRIPLALSLRILQPQEIVVH